MLKTFTYGIKNIIKRYFKRKQTINRLISNCYQCGYIL